MADLSNLTPNQADGEITIDATLVSNKITLPGWAEELHLYLADTSDGVFTSTDPTGNGRPLPQTTWTRVWIQRKGAKTQNRYVWVASASGSKVLHYLLY